jgi:hypothetical protein
MFVALGDRINGAPIVIEQYKLIFFTIQKRVVVVSHIYSIVQLFYCLFVSLVLTRFDS